MRGEVTGSRKVSCHLLLAARGDLSGACGEATSKEGGSWGKHGFRHGSKPKASDRHAEDSSMTPVGGTRK
jgi:hypothetical protein